MKFSLARRGDGQTKKKTDRQRGIHTYKLRDRHSVEQTYRQMNGQTREINQRNTNRQMDRQTDGKTEGQTDSQTDGRTDSTL